jgi:hypothetical protein
MPEIGCRMQEAGGWMQDAGSRVSGVGCGIRGSRGRVHAVGWDEFVAQVRAIAATSGQPHLLSVSVDRLEGDVDLVLPEVDLTERDGDAVRVLRLHFGYSEPGREMAGEFRAAAVHRDVAGHDRRVDREPPLIDLVDELGQPEGAAVHLPPQRVLPCGDPVDAQVDVGDAGARDRSVPRDPDLDGRPVPVGAQGVRLDQAIGDHCCPHWRWPTGVLGCIDTRSVSQCATPIVASGTCIFVTEDSTTLVGANNLGTNPNAVLNATQKANWKSTFGLPNDLAASTLREAVCLAHNHEAEDHVRHGAEAQVLH